MLIKQLLTKFFLFIKKIYITFKYLYYIDLCFTLLYKFNNVDIRIF